VSDVIIGVVLRFFCRDHLVLGAKPTSQFLAQFFLCEAIMRVFTVLDWLSSISGATTVAATGVKGSFSVRIRIGYLLFLSAISTLITISNNLLLGQLFDSV